MAGSRKRAPARRSSAGRSSIGRSTRTRKRRRRRRRARGIAAIALLLPRSWPRLPVLDQRARDVLALGLLAAGVFMGFVLYGGWDGGRAGHGLAVAFGWVLGRARVLAPITLVAGGGALALGPALSGPRTPRSRAEDPEGWGANGAERVGTRARSAGVICLFASATLALAAGTFGLSSGPGRGAESWNSAFLQTHGGIAGEALYQLANRLVQNVGVDIIVVFLALVAVTLLTGASLGGAIRGAGRSLIATT